MFGVKESFYYFCGLKFTFLNLYIYMNKRIKTISFMLFAMALPMASAYAETSPIETIEIVQQNGTVTGTVVDATGEPLTGASVVVKGTTKGAMVDNDGHFSIANVKAGQTLRVSFIGYQAKEVKWDGQPLNIVLEEDNNALGEVVVTAMGIKKDAKKVGYAVSTINADELTKTGGPNIAAGLYGKASGVRVQAAPGGGTSAVSFSIRGLSSITGNTQPLIVVDGVPVHNGNTNNDGYWDNQRINSNGMVDINPEDIENLSILKGAAASALYGSEAANGVVMITTKKGKNGGGTTTVDFTANVSGDFVAYMPEIQKQYGPGYDNYVFGDKDPIALSGFRQLRLDRNGNTITTTNSETYYSFGPSYEAGRAWLQKNGQQVTYFDGTTREYAPIDHNQWADIFRTGINQTYNVSLVNSSERNNVRLSYTFNDVRAMQYNSNNHKHNFNLNGTFDVCKGVKINYTASYLNQYIKNRPYRISRLTNNYSGMFGGFTDVAYIRDHTVTSLGYMNSVYGANGGTYNTLTPDEQFLYSPMGSTSMVSEYFWNIMGKVQEENHNRFIGQVNPTWEIVPGLTLAGRIATDLTVDHTTNKNYSENAHVFSTNGQYSDYFGQSNSQYQIVYGDVMLSYDKTFNDIHNITANLGWNARSEGYRLSSVGTSQGLTQENWFNLAASVGQKNAGMKEQNYLKTGMFATLSYGFNSWLYAEGTIRQEKTSTMTTGNNVFWYPSASLSVLYTTMLGDKCPTWWNYGKIRFSYGIVGNAAEIYRAVSAYSQGSLQHGQTYVYNYIDTSLGNALLKPENKHEYEIGIENKWFNNRLGMEFNFYYNDIKDQILPTTSAASMGGRSMMMNVGDLTNQGVELSVYGTPVQTRDWRWELRGNFAWNRNEVKRLADGLTSLQHYSTDGAVRLESNVGEPMGNWYAYTWKRDDNGNLLVGSDGLYIADKSEMHKVGNAMPKVTGGFGTSLSYKNLTLDIAFDYRVGGAVLNLPYQYMMAVGNIKESVGVRDASTGGLFYYSDTDDVTDKSSLHRVDPIDGYVRGETMINGHYVWDNGLIQEGVKEDGTPNDIIVTQFEANDGQLGWGSGANQSYEPCVQNNTYVKCREISLGYTLPEVWTKKIACSRLTVSAYARNPFYVYRTLKMFDAETTDGTNWIYQAQIGGSTASARTFGVSLRATFGATGKASSSNVAIPAPVQYVEKVVEKPVEKIVEKVVEKEVVKEVVKDGGLVQNTYVVTFPVNSSEIQNTAELSGIKAGSTVEVVAYASPEGNADANQVLSQKRADAVAKYLKDKGVNVVRVNAKGADSEHANRIAIVTIK